MCQFRIYVPKIIKIKPHYVSSHLLKLIAWQCYVVLYYGSKICNVFVIYCSICVKFLHVRYLIIYGVYQVGISLFSFINYAMHLKLVRICSSTE